VADVMAFEEVADDVGKPASPQLRALPSGYSHPAS